MKIRDLNFHLISVTVSLRNDYVVSQTHLESSISRHKAHIMKLELILRLLDNDELSPEEVNDAKDFVDDYVERNQVNSVFRIFIKCLNSCSCLKS